MWTRDSPATATPSSVSDPGSGTGVSEVGVLVVVWGEKLVTLAVPSRFVLIVAANPSVKSVVSVGTVPAASENMLNAKVLPDVDVPSGELIAGRGRRAACERAVGHEIQDLQRGRLRHQWPRVELEIERSGGPRDAAGPR